MFCGIQINREVGFVEPNLSQKAMWWQSDRQMVQSRLFTFLNYEKNRRQSQKDVRCVTSFYLLNLEEF